MVFPTSGPDPQRDEGQDEPTRQWVPTAPSPAPVPPGGPSSGGGGPWAEAEGPPGPAEEEKTFNWFSSDPQARRGRMPFDTGRGFHWVAGIVFWAVVAFLALNTLLLAVDFLLGGAFTEQVELDAAAVWVNGLLLVIGLAVPPLLWVAAFYEGGWRAWAHGLFLRSHRPVVHVLLGLVGAVGMLVFAMIVGFLLSQLGYEPENPVVDELAEFVTWPLVFWIALSAAVGEELFFRGFLQPRVGIVLSAVLFGFLHLSYGVPIQVVMPLVFGFLLSTLVVLTRSIVTAMVAHFGYNFAVGALLIAGRELGEFDWILVLLGLSA